MEGPLIAVPGSFTGRTDVGPGTEALARLLGEPAIVDADVAAVRAGQWDAGASPVADVPAALGDAPVHIHLDCDVIEGYPAAFPVPGGPSAEQVRALLASVVDGRRVIAITVTAVTGDPHVPASILEVLP